MDYSSGVLGGGRQVEVFIGVFGFFFFRSFVVFKGFSFVVIRLVWSRLVMFFSFQWNIVFFVVLFIVFVGSVRLSLRYFLNVSVVVITSRFLFVVGLASVSQRIWELVYRFFLIFIVKGGYCFSGISGGRGFKVEGCSSIRNRGVYFRVWFFWGQWGYILFGRMIVSFQRMLEISSVQFRGRNGVCCGFLVRKGGCGLGG